MSEALAEGMTVIDYAPNPPAAEDIDEPGGVDSQHGGGGGAGHRGVRWSER